MLTESDHFRLCLAEECLEIGEAAMRVGIRLSKLLRFGDDEVQNGEHKTNMERLVIELGDLAGVIDFLKEKGLITGEITVAKRVKLEKFMAHARKVGAIREDGPKRNPKFWWSKDAGDDPEKWPEPFRSAYYVIRSHDFAELQNRRGIEIEILGRMEFAESHRRNPKDWVRDLVGGLVIKRVTIGHAWKRDEEHKSHMALFKKDTMEEIRSTLTKHFGYVGVINCGRED